MVFKKTLRILCALFKFMTVARNDFKSFELSSALLERHVCQLITQVGTTFGRVESLYFHVIELCDWLGTRQVWTMNEWIFTGLWNRPI
jgi:hypothetical protein